MDASAKTFINTCCSDEMIESFAERMKVCGHPVRLKLLCLIERQDACVSDLWRCLNQSQPVVSQHLAILKEKGIVASEIRGNKRIYSIADPFIKGIVSNFTRMKRVAENVG
jgi:DNA-binding transcriptional ArsR family regulator